MRSLAGLLPTALVAMTLAACGAGDERPASTAPAATTDLRVEVAGAGDPVSVELRCGGGAEPCDRSRLRRLARVLEPGDPAQACTQQYGGPERAHVTGTLDGKPVEATVTRTNGCGIADYEALFSALGRKPPLAG